jgi:hypothetical protein
VGSMLFPYQNGASGVLRFLRAVPRRLRAGLSSERALEVSK